MSLTSPRFSAVNEFQPANAIVHFASKLSFEVDPADVHFDLEKGVNTFVVVDTRSATDYECEHIPGAVSLPHRQMNEETTRDLPHDHIIITYCWGPACNASTKGALKLALLGFTVKELIGGIEGWKADGFKTSAE